MSGRPLGAASRRGIGRFSRHHQIGKTLPIGDPTYYLALLLANNSSYPKTERLWPVSEHELRKD